MLHINTHHSTFFKWFQENGLDNFLVIRCIKSSPMRTKNIKKQCLRKTKDIFMYIIPN